MCEWLASMKSSLDERNNATLTGTKAVVLEASMKSSLDERNNTVSKGCIESRVLLQ